MNKKEITHTKGKKPDIQLNKTDYSRVSHNLIDNIVSINPAGKALFEQNYAGANLFMDKYRLARGLIEDGRFDDPIFLFENFMHSRLIIEKPYDQKTVKLLKDQLHFLLIKKGILAPNSMDRETSERFLTEEFKKREDFQDLIQDGWPIEVVGQLMTVDVFTNITNEKKLEEYRAWTTRSLLRDYLGALRGKKAQRDELSIIEMIDRIPKKIFADPKGIKYHLVEHYIEERLMQNITDEGVYEGLISVEKLIDLSDDSHKKIFIQNLYDKFYDIATNPLKGNFSQKVLLKNQEKPFPSFEQMTFVYNFTHYDTRLLTADTGLGKTGAAYLAMENSDATRVLVIAPASGRATWNIEEQKLFNKPDNIYTINSTADISEALSTDKKYIVISKELIGYADHKPQILNGLKHLIETCSVDGAIIDEIDNLNDPNAISSKNIMSLIQLIRQNHVNRTKKYEHTAPIIGLTATPIRSKLSDLNVTMALLYPDRYVASVSTATKDKKTFSDTHINRPDLVYSTLYGEKRMFRWERAKGVQQFQYETVSVDISPFEQYVYDVIQENISTHALNKIKLLEDCILNPHLVKAEAREVLGSKYRDTFDIDDVLVRLKNILQAWKKTINKIQPRDPSDFLSVDRLVELGFGDMALSCFLSELLENGVDTIVDEFTKDTTDPELKELKVFWQTREVSQKYRMLQSLLTDALTWKRGENGKEQRQKVFIVSPSRKQGRTGDVLQRTVIMENGESKNLYASYELDTLNDLTLVKKIKEWTKGLCDTDQTLIIDGDVTVGKERDAVIARWVNDPNCAVLVTTLEATYLSRDFTLNIIEDAQGREISGVIKILLSPPWHYQQVKQIAGRSRRQGQLIPTELFILESQDTIDQGKGEVVLYTHLLSRMALSGIVLTSKEQEFFDSKRVGAKILQRSSESRFLRDLFSFVRGAGEEKLVEYFNGTTPQMPDLTNAQRIAEKFFDSGNDEYHINGYNAELVASLIKYLADENSAILSLGAGTLLLQRKLKKGIDNVDINPYVMQTGWTVAQQYGGQTILARASQLSEDIFPSQNYDVVDMSFAFNWSNLSERIKILSQIHRVLKKNGKYILTFSESVFDENSFKQFTDILEKHFSTRILPEFSGRSFGKNHFGLVKRIGWCITGEIIGELHVDGLNAESLRFINEQEEWVSKGPKKKKDNAKNTDQQMGQYPSPHLRLEFDHFEIINNQNETTIIAPQNGSPALSEQSQLPDKTIQAVTEDNIKTETVIQDFTWLRGENAEEYKKYRNGLLAPVMKLTGFAWKDAEELISKVFTETQTKGTIDNRIIAYSRILKEIKRSVDRKTDVKDVFV